MPLPIPQPVYLGPEAPTTVLADSAGYLVDPLSLEVRVTDADGVEAFPRTAVLLTDYPTGDRIGRGYYRARDYDPQSDLVATAGARIVTWFAVLEAGAAEVSWTTRTERLTAPKPDFGVPYYALISDLRAEGFTTAALSDARAHVLLARASAYIEAFTGRRFVAEPRRILLNGPGSSILQISEPIIAIDEDETIVGADDAVTSLGIEFGRDSVKVYNRHLSQRLRQPDDRQNPKLEVYSPIWGSREGHQSRVSPMAWPRGQQNVRIAGHFGFTEPDGSPMGRTPQLITHAAMLFVRKEMELIGGGTRSDASATGRIIKEKTRDQEVGYASPGTIAGGKPGSPAFGALTGDPEIDTILMMFRRQHSFAAV